MGKGKRGKILIWVACPAGVGSCVIITLQAQEFLDAQGLGKKIEIEAVSDNLAQSEGCDILLTTLNIAKRLEKQLDIPVVGLLNVMSDQEYQEKLLPVVKELLEKEALDQG